MSVECRYLLIPPPPSLQRNALRVEFISAAPRCSLLHKIDKFGREYDPIKYVLSGGSAVTCANPCVSVKSEMCPRNNVPAERNIFSEYRSGPCPLCRTINRRMSVGIIVCRECKHVFTLYDDE